MISCQTDSLTWSADAGGMSLSLRTPLARLNISNFAVKSAKLIRLRANTGYDENTLQQPTNISPTEHELSPECNTVDVELPAYSLNIIRIKM